MAYLVIYQKDQEIARRKLDGAMTIGRSAECELSVHDILLSRRHCKIEPAGDGWIVTDLGSKNGTRIGGTPVFQLPLADGDVIRLGKTAIRFRTGELRDSSKPKSPGIKRPADPFEALAGTVVDITVRLPVIAPNGIPLPQPKPSPREPAAYAQEEVRELVSQLVSSSWDSIYETARQPSPIVARGPMADDVRRPRPRQPRIDPALQLGADLTGIVVAARRSAAEPAPALMPAMSAPRSAASRPQIQLVRKIAMVLQGLAMISLLWPSQPL